MTRHGSSKRNTSKSESRLGSRLGVLGSLLLGITLTSCGASSSDGAKLYGGQTGDEVTKGIQRLEGHVERRTAEGPALTTASSELADFAWSFYAESKKDEQNFVYSPLSLAVAASMLYAGTAGETREEMQRVFSFAAEGEDFHQARNVLLQALASRNREQGENENAQALSLSNDFWMAERLPPEPSFLDVLSEFYGAPVHLFEGDSEDVRAAINDKVASDTNDLIEELLPPGAIHPDVVFVLTNALYFKSNWEWVFTKERTAPAPFAALGGSSVQVDMMSADEFEYQYADVDGVQVLSMPYSGRELEFVAMMPEEGTFESFVDTLTPDTVEELTGAMAFQNMNLWFPKLTIDFNMPLKAELMDAGMVDAFERAADFSPLTPLQVWLGDAFHQTEIILNEEGTEAAAATAFVGVDESVPPTPIDVTFDHPFVFFIRDVETQAVLFLGHFVSP